MAAMKEKLDVILDVLMAVDISTAESGNPVDKVRIFEVMPAPDCGRLHHDEQQSEEASAPAVYGDVREGGRGF